MKSIGAMLEQLDGLLGTNDLTEWEQDFVESVLAWHGVNSTGLSEKQIAIVERIYKKHFGDA